jgi:hypothetical protein
MATPSPYERPPEWPHRPGLRSSFRPAPYCFLQGPVGGSVEAISLREASAPTTANSNPIFVGDQQPVALPTLFREGEYVFASHGICRYICRCKGRLHPRACRWATQAGDPVYTAGLSPLVRGRTVG